MRTFAGYLIIAALLPLLIAIVFMTGSEMKQWKSFHHVLQEKIPIADQINLPQSSIIKASDGAVISEIQRPVNRINLSSEEIPPFLKNLFIMSEDKHFYDHLGFDFSSIGRALAVNIQSNQIEQGASTITQQLARNLFLTNEKSYNRKLSELLYAYEIERMYSKDNILELYLNVIYFQNGAYGIEAAAQFYFQKQTSELSKAQLAFLAAIPNNPTLYDPLIHFDKTKKRQERLIDQLVQNQFLHKDEAEKIKAESIVLQTRERIDLFPDYVTYVESELKELIAKQEGIAIESVTANEEERKSLEAKLDERVKEVISSGIIIHTALDPAIQQKAKTAIETRLPYQNIEGAAVVINHESQRIIALIGGKHYQKYDFNRGFQAYRQPGSAIKPLLVYAPYFERTNASTNKKVNASAFCKNGYCPENYGGAKYGMVSIERAFIQSYNTPAVRLFDLIGIENGFKDLANFGFAKVSKTDYVLPAAIGGFSVGVSPLELTSAYTVFANNGEYLPARAIDKVTNLSGELLYSWDEAPIQVWNKTTTDKINELLKKTVQSGTARKAAIPNQGARGKTGTTNDFQDYWFVGITDQYTAGIWVGKDQPQNIQFIEAAAPQQQIWKAIMTRNN